MRIAFDAKRAYHNNTGLGNYSRTLVLDLARFFPDNEYFMLNPKPSKQYSLDGKNIHEVLPKGFFSRKLSSLWRSKWMTKDLIDLDIELFHGLSHEIPVNIHRTNIRSVVTIHDLIFEHYPEQYNPLDVKLYQRKFRHACQYADRIIAISEQTKKDIVDFYQTDPNKIDVCYQSCDSSFNPSISKEQKELTAAKFSLPSKFFLSVGSIIERKNLLNICKAVQLLEKDNEVNLVVIGKGSGKYKSEIDNFILKNNLSNKITFLKDVNSADLPAIYSLSEALIYPSYFEGFGIPVLEALSVGVPVITSSVSCLPEAGGDAAFYVNPDKPEEIANSMLTVLKGGADVQAMIQKGFVHAEKFSNKNCAAQVMKTYQTVMKTR
ncbi:glycosyltransferase family 1 protein [Pedobacter sp. B4-66]|uniref:glycosyltransferase family 4 protein n=1 Tax=Pedobacter sp. B4-66 TaxID=2817280 RepID=UPI001BDB1526|nr:glycosyltransferase family 1 protein [Pedobacter sp. B4-66]